MTGATSALYEPLIERDLERIPDAVRAFRAAHSSQELWEAVTRFAILAYAPSQHAKHAVLACLSAYDLRDAADFDALVLECARYTAEARQPWSEPPIFEPPPPSDGSLDELRAAIAKGDRLRAERWLSARLDSPDEDLLTVAREDLSDYGHKAIVTNAALRLASLLGAKGKYVTLRIAVWELVAYRGAGGVVETDIERLIERAVAEGGSPESMHAVYLYDALRDASPPSSAQSFPTPAPYRLAKDCGSLLKAHAVARRLHTPNAHRLIAAAEHNLAHGVSFEDFSFA
jgi:hypothetical protein